jgi:uncharacterized membrane protein YedE/YeeE
VRQRAAGALIGLVFGLALCWSGMSSPVVIREALLLQDSYLFLMFASAVATATAGLWLLRRSERRALLADAPIGWAPERPARRHVLGSLMFGIGWGVADACPGPIATQVGQGVPWALFTLAGAATGIYVFLRRGRAETEPAVERATPATPATVAG